VRNAGLDAGTRERELDESDWTNPDDTRLTPYVRSKTIAELAAWDYMRGEGAGDRLVTVQPGAIVGPLLWEDRSYSLEAVERLLTGKMPGIPRLGFSFVDVRDVAALHVAAMTAPEAGGQRLIAAGTFLWLAEVGAILRERLGADAAKVPRRNVPNFVVRGMALVDPSVRTIVGDLGRKTTYSLENARRRTGWTPRPVQDTIADCGRSLLGAPAPAPAAGATA
jgi:nucleoside-diphosphate-sugar epimerase